MKREYIRKSVISWMCFVLCIISANVYGVTKEKISRIPAYIFHNQLNQSPLEKLIYEIEEEKRLELERKEKERMAKEQAERERIEKEERESERTITISAAGDVTLGYYAGQNEWNRFDKVATQNGYSYFFKNVAPIFKADDLTIVNLEGPLTVGGKMVEKQFAMKGEPAYTQILRDGAVETVSLANNHTYDYGQEGYRQTQEALQKAGIGYFGDQLIQYVNVKEVKVALIGAKGWDKNKATKDTVQNLVTEAKEKADLVIIMFHWGIEREFYPNAIQKELAYHAIDAGADLVLGSHPHVIQGIEVYKGKNIVYSLGNFCFGGNRNPSDKDAFIYQETFRLTEEGIVSMGSNVIPCSISSVKDKNNYQPTPLVGAEANHVLGRLKEYSSKFEQSYFGSK